MTVLIGIQTDKGAYIGADSQTTSYWHLKQSGTQKITKKDGFVFACCGMAKGSSSIPHRWVAPKRGHKQPAEEYIFKEFSPNMLKFLEDENCIVKFNSQTLSEVNMVFSYEGQLYTFETCGHVTKVNDYIASGCGLEFAYGSLFSTERMISENEEIEMEDYIEYRIKLAIDAAGHFDTFCNDDVQIEFQEKV